MPEDNKNLDLTSRIDLVDGYVRSSGSIEGSKRLLEILLKSWTAHAVLAFADDLSPYLEVLGEKLDAPPRHIENRISDVSGRVISKYDLNFFHMFEESWHRYKNLLGGLRMDAHRELTLAMGPDFVVKIGNDALTPDFLIAQSDVALTDMYLESVFEIAVETVTNLKDMDIYTNLYREFGVQELWIFNVEEKEFSVFFRNSENQWQPVENIRDIYESISIPGLSLDIENCWKKSNSIFATRDYKLLTFEGGPNDKKKTSGVKWGDIRFNPQIGVAPKKLSFEEFISWAPESKFEWMDSYLMIGSDIGSRNMIGMLAQTIGVEKMIDLLPVDDWLIAIGDRRSQLENQTVLREDLISQARKAAKILKTEFNQSSVKLIGEWLESPTINKWTYLKIVIPDIRGIEYHKVYESLRNVLETEFHILSGDNVTGSDKKLLSESSMDL